MSKLWREADTIDRTFLVLGLVLDVPVVLAAALYALAVIAYLAGAGAILVPIHFDRNQRSTSSEIRSCTGSRFKLAHYLCPRPLESDERLW